MDIDLTSMNSAELEKLQKDVEKALKSVRTREIEAARKAAEKAVAEFGLTLADVAGGGKPGKSRSKSVAAAKYRNPKAPEQVWSGRGRRPDWIKAALDSGADLDDLMI
ncbi:H-NS family nucleoid-associated regulatory protein [Shimia biformata]|uniref:H-NS histone family protein n=1 Tax=Shimia biformata TaxID=1294299 RepID=UPI001950B17B|nr:H-NS histone family protein [Shimia biformata]